MNDPRPYFPLYTADFWGSDAVALMDFEAVGLFFFLLCREWQEGSLSKDERLLKRLAGDRVRDWDSCWAQVRPQFFEEGGRLFNRRLEAERAAADGISEKQSDRAKLRWERFRADRAAKAMPPECHGTATALPPQSHGNATAMPGEDRMGSDGTGKDIPAAAAALKRATALDLESQPLPAHLDRPDVREALRDYQAVRAENRHPPIKAQGWKTRLKEIEPMTAEQVIRALRQNGPYQGWVPLKGDPVRSTHVNGSAAAPVKNLDSLFADRDAAGAK